MKWCSLSYEESTWELQEDVDPVKIREFEDLKKIPEIKLVVSTQMQMNGNCFFNYIFSLWDKIYWMFPVCMFTFMITWFSSMFDLYYPKHVYSSL